MAAYAGLGRPEVLVTIVLRVEQLRAQLRILHLREFLFRGAGRHLAPFGQRVVEVPVLERESETAADRAALAEDLAALRAIPLDEPHAAAVNFRIVARRNDRLPQDRPLRLIRQPFNEG